MTELTIEDVKEWVRNTYEKEISTKSDMFTMGRTQLLWGLGEFLGIKPDLTEITSWYEED